MCACVLKKVASEVGELIHDRDYMPCRGLLETSSNATLKRLVLRKQRRILFSSHLKGRYSYRVSDISLSDDGVLIAACEPKSDATTGPSLLNNDDLFHEKSLGEYRSNAVTATKTAAQLSTLEDTFDVAASVITSSSATTSLSCLKVRHIKGDNLERLIAELQHKWRFNKEHRLWEHITERKTNELCFISSIVATEKELTLQCKHSSNGGFRGILKKLVELSLDVSRNSSHYLVIPAGVALAYKVQRLVIDPKNGRITVPLGTMATSGDDGTQIDPDKEIEDGRLYYSEFFGKLSKEKQDSLRKALMNHLSLDTAQPTRESLTEVQESPQQESSSDSGDGSLPTADAILKDRQRLVDLKKLAKAALPTAAEPKEEQIAQLLQALGVAGFPGLSNECAAVYGIRYFITALLQLSPELLYLFSNCFHTAGDGWQIVNELERLIESKAGGSECELLASFSHDTSTDDDSFLLSWRAAYVAAVHTFGLPVV